MELEQYSILVNYLKTQQYPVGYLEKDKQRLQQQSKHFLIINEQLYKKNRRKEPTNPLRVLRIHETEAILKYMHEDILTGHFGYEGTYQRIATKYWWNGMGTTIKDFVKSCSICQLTGTRTTKTPLHPIKIGQPFERIVIDLVGPCPITTQNNRYIVTAIDYFTRWPEAKAIPNKQATTIARFIFEEIICRHGCPKEIQSDNGTEFVNEIIKELANQFNIKWKFSSPYHPQTNGIIERFNRTMCSVLQKYCIAFENEWDQYISAALFAYRTLRNSTTKHEPFFLTYGRDARLPIDPLDPVEELTEEQILHRIYSMIDKLTTVQNEAKQNTIEKQQKSKQRHDSKIQHIKEFQIGDKVLLYDIKQYTTHGNKFQPQWKTEWYYIHENFKNGTYRIRNQKDQLIKQPINGKQLKQYHDRKDYFEPIIVIE